MEYVEYDITFNVSLRSFGSRSIVRGRTCGRLRATSDCASHRAAHGGRLAEAVSGRDLFMFAFCVQMLHLSEHAAYLRIEAARSARRYSDILDRLADGSLHLTAVSLLGPHLTAANHLEVLDSARHKSKRDVEQLVARLRPQPDVPAVVRKLPAPTRALVPGSEVPVLALPASTPEGGVPTSRRLTSDPSRRSATKCNALCRERRPKAAACAGFCCVARFSSPRS